MDADTAAVLQQISDSAENAEAGAEAAAEQIQQPAPDMAVRQPKPSCAEKFGFVATALSF